jgi:predicted GH43/DUF377 family glycosyl hydrolase
MVTKKVMKNVMMALRPMVMDVAASAFWKNVGAAKATMETQAVNPSTVEMGFVCMGEVRVVVTAVKTVEIVAHLRTAISNVHNRQTSQRSLHVSSPCASVNVEMLIIVIH